MAPLIRSLFNSARSTFAGPGDGVPGVDSLFPKVRPEVDGDDCDHDCASCDVRYPRSFKIEEYDDLYGHVKGWSTHVLVATGKTDWVRDVADEKGSLMEAFDRAPHPTNGRMMLSASNIPTPHHSTNYSEPTTVLLLPAFTIIENVTPAKVAMVVDAFINNAVTTKTRIDAVPKSLPDPLPSAADITTRPCPHSALVLLCSQKTRDARCGQSAPLIRKELERHLRPLGLFRDLDDERPGGVGIYFISHVGGHKYSANVMIYRRENAFGIDQVARATDGDVKPVIQSKPAADGAAQCLWLARIRPADCEGLVKFTILQGKVIKPESQLRGGFDRTTGALSW